MNRKAFLKKCGAGLAGIIAAGKAPAAVVKSLIGGYEVDRIGESAEPFKNPYVTDGLVAMWDGIENVGWGEHDDNATIWKDLIGNRDLTIVNSAVFSTNHLYCNKELSAIGDSPINPRYAEAVLRYDDTFSTIGSWGREIALMLYSYGNRWNKGFGITTWASGGCVTGRNSNLIFRFSDITRINQYTTNFSGNLQYGFCVNGISVEESVSADSYTFPGAATGISIGANKSNQYTFKGGVYCVRLYNRVLNANEQARNYEIDCIRFNLP